MLLFPDAETSLQLCLHVLCTWGIGESSFPSQSPLCIHILCACEAQSLDVVMVIGWYEGCIISPGNSGQEGGHGCYVQLSSLWMHDPHLAYLVWRCIFLALSVP